MHNVLLLTLLLIAAPAFAEEAQVNGIVQVFFSPKEGCTEAAVTAIAAAKSSVLVQAYGFTSKPIRDALLAAHARGVKVQVIADKSNEDSDTRKKANPSIAPGLKAAGVEVVYDEAHRIAHNKVMVIDGSVVLTGSFNWTNSAENNNAENLAIIPSKELADIYAANWSKHYAHSVAK